MLCEQILSDSDFSGSPGDNTSPISSPYPHGPGKAALVVQRRYGGRYRPAGGLLKRRLLYCRVQKDGGADAFGVSECWERCGGSRVIGFFLFMLQSFISFHYASSTSCNFRSNTASSTTFTHSSRCFLISFPQKRMTVQPSSNNFLLMSLSRSLFREILLIQ